MITKTKKYPRPTQEEVRRLFDYDPASGLLIRKKATSSAPTIVFNLNNDGYITVGVCGRNYGAHTIIWLHQTGKWPKKLDHKNQCRCDNRISNLREVTNAQNQRNKSFSTNKSGVPGVCFTYPSWIAKIGRANKNYYLGAFDSFTEAVCHRLAAEQCIDSVSYELNSPAYKYVCEHVQKR